MKFIKTIALAGLIAFSSTTHANSTEPTEPTSKVTSEAVKSSMKLELGNLLKESNLNLIETTKAKVSFTINSDNEVVVLNVETQNSSVEKFIQNRLNYKKLKAEAIKGQTYHLPVTIEGR